MASCLRRTREQYLSLGLATLALLLGSCDRQEIEVDDKLTVSEFLGPSVGQRYIYAIGRQDVLAVTGFAVDEAGAVSVEEQLLLERIPVSNTHEPDSPQSKAVPTKKYKLVALDKKLFKQTTTRKTVLLQEPLSEKSPQWTANWLLGESSYDYSREPKEQFDFSSRQAVCKITTVDHETFLGEDKRTVAVKCSLSVNSLRTITVAKYMENIGLFELTTEGFDEGGQSFGKQVIRLVRIEET